MEYIEQSIATSAGCRTEPSGEISSRITCGQKYLLLNSRNRRITRDNKETKQGQPRRWLLLELEMKEGLAREETSPPPFQSVPSPFLKLYHSPHLTDISWWLKDQSSILEQIFEKTDNTIGETSSDNQQPLKNQLFIVYNCFGVPQKCVKALNGAAIDLR